MSVTEDERIAFHGRLYFMDMLNTWGVSPAQKQIIYDEWMKYKKAHPNMRMKDAAVLFGNELRDALYRNIWDVRRGDYDAVGQRQQTDQPVYSDVPSGDEGGAVHD